MSAMTCTRLTIWTLCGVLLQMIGFSVFVLGFFPVKPTLVGVSGPESYRSPANRSTEDFNFTGTSSDELRSLFWELSKIPPSYDRLIFMVVDGLPAEFVLGKDGQPPSIAMLDAMPYTQSLLANGMAIGYHAKAAPPTVTMPRLKAMVSGAIGGFLDVAFNFHTQALVDDNLLGQFFRIGWKMVMLGDDTWLKLFPQLFLRHDAVSSFFVKDTVLVDHNVSRHLPSELNQDDWNLLILHYLGVDHVGHIGGRKSVLMVPKLKEMDEVIKMIHRNNVLSYDKDRGQSQQTLLVIVSDHGMTDGGNHGGSSQDETDSLALFIGPGFKVPQYSSYTHKSANQVDITPTLAILFGVPIPLNNVGVVIAEGLDSLTDDQRLRALELNSWQLLKLLAAQLPDLSCLSLASDDHDDDDRWSTISTCDGILKGKLCCLYSNAAVLHNLWRSKNILRFNSSDLYNQTVWAYYDFLSSASVWLSRRVTDKPVGQLALALLAMFLSCLVVLWLLFCLQRESLKETLCCIDLKYDVQRWSFDEIFALMVVLILVISMGSSSMIEEEQYIWHFVMSTFCCILFRKAMQSIPVGMQSSLGNGLYKRRYSEISSFLALLIAGRIMRGWHQGGVNWTHFPDISKWLEHAGHSYIKSIQLLSGILIISLSLFSFSMSRLNRSFIFQVKFTFLISGLLVLHHIMKYQDNTFLSSSYNATVMAQVIYAILGVSTFGTVLASPWLTPALICGEWASSDTQLSASPSMDAQIRCVLAGTRESSYLSGWAYISCWCLLQLLLQQPINSMPVFLLLVQIWASMNYFCNDELHHKQWVQVSALYFLGMAGHFGLGNTNTLATIDVAGAFIGISSYSTLFSGVLMFSITYASPMLFLLSLVLYISVEGTSFLGIPDDADLGPLLKMRVAIPCLVPLGINSILLTVYTIVLLQMRNHLFIWSVFSPKYLYVCATTVCIYIGLSIVAGTQIYICWVCSLRRRMGMSLMTDTNKISQKWQRSYFDWALKEGQ
ncbi:hypothetical protein Nepgr_025986 [Nepenthes gracilis]|uniref:GPI ethanolamine phosphate transferase 2 C-terminal domain-containing protein n=1 Tax=Nepenthes gracilis TaxID=150966 RepID=A0AAD3T789_NEPGR|nr:hypothetical protein Nepgr_025986 [Nepenthes gracilis]